MSTMISTTRSIALLTTLLAATASVACSAPEARPASSAAAPRECGGGVVSNEDDAARFEGCETIVGNLEISGSSLVDLAQLQSVRRVTGKLSVVDNAKLISLAGLKGVERAGSVEINDNPLLCGYFGLLTGLQVVDQPLELRKNRGLSQRDIRSMLERVEVRVTVDARQASL
jgi:hypothetical protein